MRYKAVLFDNDGTVLNTDRLVFNAWSALGRELRPEGIDLDDVKKHFGRTLLEAAVLLAEEYGIKDYDLDKLDKTYWAYQDAHHEEIDGIYPGIKELMSALKERGILTAVVTSGHNGGCDIELGEFGIRQYIDVIIGSEDIDRAKPDPDPALKACQKLGVKPEETIFIGDSRHDMNCGKTAGCTTVLVGWSTFRDKGLKGNEIPDYIFDDVTEVLGLL